MAITQTTLKHQQQTAERNQQIIDLFDSSLTATEVAQQCDTTVDVVQRIWNKIFDKKARVARRAKARKAQSKVKSTRSGKDSVKALELFESDLTAIEVAKQCGYKSSAGMLRLWQSHFGKEKCKERANKVKKATWQKKGTFESEVLDQLDKADLSGREIAKETGCSFATVRRVIKKNFENDYLMNRKKIRLENSNEEALDLFYGDLSAGDVAEHIGLSRQATLSLWQRYYGKEATQQRSDEHRAQVTEKDVEQMKKKLKQEGYDFTFVRGSYVDSLSPVELMCSEKHRWVTQWRYLKMGNRCGFCNAYKREKILGEILKQIFSNERIEYQSNLGFLKPQRVDYGIRSLKLAFEHDGEQHFRPVRFGGMSLQKAIKGFEYIQKKDKRKSDLCHKNNYALVRIRYNDELSIENITNITKGIQGA